MSKKSRPKKELPLKIAPDWRHIQEQAERFVLRYLRQDKRENANSKSFLRDFLALYGIDAIEMGAYEHQVAKLGDQYGFVDFFLPGKMVVEFKSGGKNLDKALLQALGYYPGLSSAERPRYVLVCDLRLFRLHDLQDSTKDTEFSLEDLPKNLKLFAFLIEQESESSEPEKQVDIRAAELMGQLHDRLKESGYGGHDLEVLLVRLLFCLFADDTGIFEYHSFQKLIRTRTHTDGSNLFGELSALFDTLNQPEIKRSKHLSDALAGFPHVNGKLFEKNVAMAHANADIRDMLLTCCREDWSAISPAIFGSLFQAVMAEDQDDKRRNLGAHYTSEANILKLIQPLFLDDLAAQLAVCGKNKAKLNQFHDKLASLRFLDPACGCGNFLIVAYRELRRLELKVLDILHPPNNRGQRQLSLDINLLVKVNVDQFHGIELEEFPAQVAQVALWLMDHLMNKETGNLLGRTFNRLPLVKSAVITQGNALREDWPVVDYILGNPPFVGKNYQNGQQRDDMQQLFSGVPAAMLLDYVCGWYLKAALCMVAYPSIRTAFVSTNSICQGEQVPVLWGKLKKLGVQVHFAHRTFQWNNEARGKAAVHCVIVGFAVEDTPQKWLFEYTDIKGEALRISAKIINPYLVDGADTVIEKRRSPLCEAPIMVKGSQPTDGGNLLLSDEKKAALLALEPHAEEWIRPFLGSEEFINAKNRWCLWLMGCPPDVLRKMPFVMQRVEAVKKMRLASKKGPTRTWADFPTLFTENRQPETDYLLVPSVSSERREYAPIGFLSAQVVVSNLAFTVPSATMYHFGVLTSFMHNAWMRTVCGRLKSDYRYSAGMVYNNFPWPKNPTQNQQEAITSAANAVLDARIKQNQQSLADLYDPVAMPPDLRKAHQKLDRTVDAAYGIKASASEAERVAYLFTLYEQYCDRQE